MTDRVKDSVENWLDRAGTAMGGRAQRRRDALLELETTIYDRIEERTGSGQTPEDAVRDVLETLGDPAEVGGSFAPVRPLIEPHQTRLFVIHTLVLFAAHFLLVVGATLADSALAFGPVTVPPLADARAPLVVLVRVLRTLLFDAGAMLCLYALLPRASRLVRLGRATPTTRPDASRCVQSALFLSLVLVVVNFFRDGLFALYVPDEAAGGVLQIPFTGRGITSNLLLLNLWLGVSVLRDLLYAVFGERRSTMSLEFAAHGLGLFCLLRIVATKQLVDLSSEPAVQRLGATADGVGAVLNTIFVVLALLTAALVAARLVRRLFRFPQLAR